MRKTNEERVRMGLRSLNSDGYTYSYGKYKYNKGKGYLPYVKRSKRADKRGWKYNNKRNIEMEFGISID